MFGLRITPLKLLHGRAPVLGFRIEEIASEPSPPGRGQGEGVSELRPSWLHAPSPPTPLPKGEGSVLPLAYCTDVSAIPPETWAQLRGLNTLVLDLLRFRAHPTHFTYDEAVAAAEKIAAKETWFVHMAHDIIHAEVDDDLPETMHLAYDGLVLR
jgi:hypothetical protein